ncbi:uncharacterized protein LOC133834584 [Humulus lupulus]|uniref:uncharacterized protein LOC133834584 n=1 Tax=Humulus lupulus TaxID=3486 RepID=UPI002B414BD2|nr:uncharacterized protein LOC133834584 [Humulus lupulus]
MVKLASARESRLYGPRISRNRAEYINAGLYLFATVVLLGGFVAQLSGEPKSGLVLLLIALVLIAVINLHDAVAHLAGYDYRFSLMEYDVQLFLVEFLVPVVQALGSIVFFLAILFLFLQEEKGYGYLKVEKHAVNMVIAGPVLWVVGSIHNSCQVYERADGHVQILQQSVHIPFLIGSLLLTVASILNARELAGQLFHGLQLLGRRWIWVSIFGSMFLVLGGFMNVVKVFHMQSSSDGGRMRLEKLRGGAQERLLQEREGQVPLILEEEEHHQRRRRRRPTSPHDQPKIIFPPSPVPTSPYKDVLVAPAPAPGPT